MASGSVSGSDECHCKAIEHLLTILKASFFLSLAIARICASWLNVMVETDVVKFMSSRSGFGVTGSKPRFSSNPA